MTQIPFFKVLFSVVLFCSFSFSAGVASAAQFQGKVTATHDGDTLNVTLNNGKAARVRLVGTDSAEVYVNGASQGEPAYMARDFLKSLLPIGSNVQIVTTDDDVTDKHNRLLGQVFYGDIDLNQEMLKSGWSVFYLIAPFDKTMAKAYSEASKIAFEQKLGLYADQYAAVEVPYQFRLRVMGGVARNLVGNIETKKLYGQEQMDEIPVYARVFFPSEQIAKARGYKF